MHHGRHIVEKSKDFKKSMLLLIKYCYPFLIAISISIILAIISSVLSIIGPDKLKDITNLISSGLLTTINVKRIKEIAFVLLTMYVISALCGYMQHYIMATVTNKFSKKIRSEISEKINKLPLKYFDKHSYGDILSVVTNDVDTLSQSLNQSLSTIVSSITLLFGAIIMMFITSPLMALTAIFSSVFGFVFMFLIISKSQKYFIRVQNDLGNLNGHIEEVYSSHSVIKSYNGSDDAIEKFKLLNETLANNSRQGHFLSGLMHPFMGFIGNFGYVMVCIVGSILTINNIINFGVIVAFMLYVRLFTQPLNQLAQTFSSLQSCAAASERVFDFLDNEEMLSEDITLKKLLPNKVKGSVVFEHVKFGYDNDKTIIKDFNVSIKPGSKVAIVGKTGAGKTTLVNLLMKFYDIIDGDILIDGMSIKNLSRENIHDLFIMVLQDVWVFEGTIYENIKYNKENVSDKEVEDICKLIGLDHFIKTLPKGYNTLLTETESLSQGQKQLLTIARGMIKNSPFLILDEATSSVDTRTEELVQKAMDKLTVGRTSFIIAHRLSTIKDADIILMLENGNIIEQGSHGELIKLNGKYAHLYNSQFESIGQ